MSKVDTAVGKLVSMIETGELRLPETQRRYLWPATRVRDLLDSLLVLLDHLRLTHAIAGRQLEREEMPTR